VLGQCRDSTLSLSHSLLVTSLKKKKPYNNINIWRYRHKGGDISVSTAGAYSYVVAKRAGKVEKAKYNPGARPSIITFFIPRYVKLYIGIYIGIVGRKAKAV